MKHDSDGLPSGFPRASRGFNQIVGKDLTNHKINKYMKLGWYGKALQDLKLAQAEETKARARKKIVNAKLVKSTIHFLLS